MKKALIGVLSMVLVTALAGCGAPAPEEEGVAAPVEQQMDAAESNEVEAEGSATIEAPVVEEAEMTEEAPAEEAAVEAEPVEDAPAADAAPVEEGGLAGTKWTHNGISMEFLPNNEVKLSGGPVATLAPNGLTAPYTLADGAISVEVFGQVYSGTWDGEKLVVDGTEAVPAE